MYNMLNLFKIQLCSSRQCCVYFRHKIMIFLNFHIHVNNKQSGVYILYKKYSYSHIFRPNYILDVFLKLPFFTYVFGYFIHAFGEWWVGGGKLQNTYILLFMFFFINVFIIGFRRFARSSVRCATLTLYTCTTSCTEPTTWPSLRDCLHSSYLPQVSSYFSVSVVRLQLFYI